MNRHRKHSFFKPGACLLISFCYWGGPLSAQVLIQYNDIKARVFGLERVGLTWWFATAEGLFYSFEDQFTATELRPETTEEVSGRRLYSILLVGETLVVGGSDGLFVVGESNYYRQPLFEVDKNGERRPLEGLEVRTIIAGISNTPRDTVWLHTDRGLFRWTAGTDIARRVVLPNNDYTSLVFITQLNGELWAGTQEDLYKYTDSGFKAIGSISDRTEEDTGSKLPNASEMVKIGDEYYILAGGSTVGGFFGRVSKRNLYRFPGRLSTPLGTDVKAIGVINSKLWFIVRNNEIFSVEEGGIRNRGIVIDESLRQFWRLAETTEHRWLVSNDCVLRAPKQTGQFQIQACKREGFSGSNITEDDGVVWFWGGSGLYRFFGDVGIDVRLNFYKQGDEKTIRGNTVDIIGVSYDRDNEDPFPYFNDRHRIERRFCALLRSKRSEFEKDKYSLRRMFRCSEANGEQRLYLWERLLRRFRDARDESMPELRVEGGNSDIFVAIQDVSGNIIQEHYRNVVFERKPWDEWTLLFVQILAGVLAGYVLTAVVAAGWLRLLSRYARSNRRLDKKFRAYVQMIKVSQSIPFVGSFLRVFVMAEDGRRRKVLWDLCREKHCREWKTKEDRLELAVKHIKEQLYSNLRNEGYFITQEQTSLLLEGIGRLVFDFPTVDSSVLPSKLQPPECHFPIIVRLHRFTSLTQSDIRGLVALSLLQSIPSADAEFCEDLLSHGSFAFILSARPDTVNDLRAFFDTNRRNNYLIIQRIVNPDGDIEFDSSDNGDVGRLAVPGHVEAESPAGERDSSDHLDDL